MEDEYQENKMVDILISKKLVDIIQTQKGIFRNNCIDSLDRINVVLHIQHYRDCRTFLGNSPIFSSLSWLFILIFIMDINSYWFNLNLTLK